ncbi:MAG: diheme cytochrome c [Desulfobulbus sp.]|nr:diheme cytochrome c [Desulfobulbus sp.]
MKPIISTLAACLLATAAHADDDKIAVPADAPPSYVKECGSCHVAFPPQLLSAEDWQNVMNHLEKHYGDNAAIADPTRQEITAFLVRHADAHGRSSGANSSRWPLPKLTKTGWFKHEHHKVTNTLWTGPTVRSPSNCSACHERAEQGSFREEEIRMPGDPRRAHK